MDNQQAPSPVQMGARTILQQKVFESLGAKLIQATFIIL